MCYAEDTKWIECRIVIRLQWIFCLAFGFFLAVVSFTFIYLFIEIFCSPFGSTQKNYGKFSDKNCVNRVMKRFKPSLSNNIWGASVFIEKHMIGEFATKFHSMYANWLRVRFRLDCVIKIWLDQVVAKELKSQRLTIGRGSNWLFLIYILSLLCYYYCCCCCFFCLCLSFFLSLLWEYVRCLPAINANILFCVENGIETNQSSMTV